MSLLLLLLYVMCNQRVVLKRWKPERIHCFPALSESIFMQANLLHFLCDPCCNWIDWWGKTIICSNRCTHSTWKPTAWQEASPKTSEMFSPQWRAETIQMATLTLPTSPTPTTPSFYSRALASGRWWAATNAGAGPFCREMACCHTRRWISTGSTSATFIPLLSD